jgi:outer membrane receptor protein involved in Fe transport
VEIFAAAENAFNQRYYTALTPVPNPPPGTPATVPSLGAPILARIGLRYEFPGH